MAESTRDTPTVPGGERAERSFGISHSGPFVVRPSRRGDHDDPSDCIHQLSTGASGASLSDIRGLSGVNISGELARTPRSRTVQGPPRGDVLLNGLDLDGDIRPDLLDSIRDRLRDALARIDGRIGDEGGVPTPDAVDGLRLGLARTVREAIRAEMGQCQAAWAATLQESMAARSAALPQPQDTPWQRFTRWIARMIGPRTRRS